MIRKTVGFATIGLVVAAFGQGSLTPPGPPVETMKTLGQIEARTPINSSGFIIEDPGSYYLTTNLALTGTTVGVSVWSSDVVLDMNGFTISGSNGTGRGIDLQDGVENAVVKNGTIRGCRYEAITVSSSASHCMFKNLCLAENSSENSNVSALFGYDGIIVDHCRIENNHGHGITLQNRAVVMNCMITDNIGTGARIEGTEGYVADNFTMGNNENYSLTADTIFEEKTLSDVEPRTPISSSDFDIWESGSYYLSENLTLSGNADGVTIYADNVTLDLNGFTIFGDNGTGSAIEIQDGAEDVVVQNGTIHGCRYHGISVSSSASKCLFKDLLFMKNSSAGSQFNALYGHADTTVENCRFIENAGGGICVGSQSKVTENTVVDNGGVGLSVSGTGSYIADNIIRGNFQNYKLAKDNQLNLLLSEIPETIEWPCSIKLAGTLNCTEENTDGLTVNSDYVSINLAGHALIGPGGEEHPSGYAIIQTDSYVGLKVFNGTIVDWIGKSIPGIAAGDYAELRNLTIRNTYSGININNRGQIQNCTVVSSFGGIEVKSYNRVADCSVSVVGDGKGIGIYAVGSGNHIEKNRIFCGIDAAVQVDGTDNFITQNSAHGGSPTQGPYNIAPGNANGKSISVGNDFSGVDPWANTEF